VAVLMMFCGEQFQWLIVSLCDLTCRHVPSWIKRRNLTRYKWKSLTLSYSYWTGTKTNYSSRSLSVFWAVGVRNCGGIVWCGMGKHMMYPDKTWRVILLTVDSVATCDQSVCDSRCLTCRQGEFW